MWKFRCRKISSSIFVSIPTSRLLNLKTLYEIFSNKTSCAESCKETRCFRLIYICYALVSYQATCLTGKLTTKKSVNLCYSEIQVLWKATTKPFSIFIAASQSQSFEENVTSVSRIY